jgi:hypothetical protein
MLEGISLRACGEPQRTTSPPVTLNLRNPSLSFSDNTQPLISLRVLFACGSSPPRQQSHIRKCKHTVTRLLNVPNTPAPRPMVPRVVAMVPPGRPLLAPRILPTAAVLSPTPAAPGALPTLLPVAAAVTAGQRVWHADSKAWEGLDTPSHAHAAVVCCCEAAAVVPAAAGAAGTKAHAALWSAGSTTRKQSRGNQIRKVLESAMPSRQVLCSGCQQQPCGISSGVNTATI